MDTNCHWGGCRADNAWPQGYITGVASLCAPTAIMQYQQLTQQVDEQHRGRRRERRKAHDDASAGDSGIPAAPIVRCSGRPPRNDNSNRLL